MLKNNEMQHEHGYRLGAVINDRVGDQLRSLFTITSVSFLGQLLLT